MPKSKNFTKALRSPKYQEKLRNARLCNNDKSTIHLPRQHLPLNHGRVCYERFCKKNRIWSHLSTSTHAGTSNEEDGNPVHYGTQNKLREEGIPCGNHRARQMMRKDYEEFDYLIGMEQWNICNINRIIRKDPEQKVHLLLEYAGDARDIADPWYTGNFDVTYEDVKEGCEAFLQYLMRMTYIET